MAPTVCSPVSSVDNLDHDTNVDVYKFVDGSPQWDGYGAKKEEVIRHKRFIRGLSEMDDGLVGLRMTEFYMAPGVLIDNGQTGSWGDKRLNAF